MADEYDHAELLSNLEVARKVEAKIMELSNMMSDLLAPCLEQAKNPERTLAELEEIRAAMPLTLESIEVRRLINARRREEDLARFKLDPLNAKPIKKKTASDKAATETVTEEIKQGLVEALKKD